MATMPVPPLPPPLPAPAPAPRPPRPPRPPAPGPVVWIAFLFGPSVVLAFGCVVVTLVNSTRPPDAGELMGVAAVGAVAGMVLGTCLVGGLALATRFFSGMVGRVVGGLLLGLTLLIGLAGVAFAGCMCVINGGKSFR